MQYTSKLFGVASGLAMAGLAVLACGKSEDSGSSGALALTGTVSSAVTVDDARAIAIDGDGHTVSAYLDADRGFTLRLPVGRSYRVVIANPRREGGLVQVAHLTLNGDEWLGANEEGSVDLGVLVPTSNAAPSGGSDLAIRTYGVPPTGGGDHDGDHDDDADDDDDDKKSGGGSSGSACDDDDDGDADLCTDGHDTEVKPSKDPGDKCKAKDHGKGRHEGRGRRHHHHHPKSCACPPDSGTSDGGATSDGSTSDSGSDAAVGGDAGIGGECLVTSDCQLGLVCSGGICHAPNGGVGAECLVTADCLPGLMCVGGLCSLP